ncbi:ATP-binding protein, partial [Candidatus Pacebacteria bacterium]|nr:ATP-binding protein [Candidatus Paceibacterota bacterium]
VVTKDLKKSKEKFEKIFYDSSIGIALVGLKGEWLEINNSLVKILGYEREELLTKTFQDITHKDDLKTDLKFVKECIDGKTDFYQTEKRFLHKNGHYIWAILSVSIIRDENNKPSFFVSQILDITHRKDVDKAKSEFVSLASHQLRTPLSSINWYSEMLMDGDAGKLNKKQKEYLDQIAIGNKRMIDLVNSLLDVSRLELGTFSVDPENADIKKVSDQIFKEIKNISKEKKIKLTKKYEKDLPEISIDIKLTQMIVQNLLSNAVKYTPEKGKVNFRIFKSGKNIQIDVTDTGYGIPDSQKEKIFTKFFRAENVTVLDTEGTGLGLYIIKSVVDTVGGKIWFESKEGKGTTFSVQIPLSGMKKKDGTKKLGS